MITHVYACRKEGLTIDECKASLANYADCLKSVNANSISYSISSSLQNCADYDILLTTMRNYYRACIESVSFVYNEALSQNLLSSIGRKFFTKLNGTTISEYKTEKIYISLYVQWVFETIYDMLDSLLVNGGVSRVSLIGDRTNEYLSDIGLAEVPKRFGSPNDYSAGPLVFRYPNVNLFGPPMTRRTYTLSQIKKVYEVLGFGSPVFVKCGKTTLARPMVQASALIGIDMRPKFANDLGIGQNSTALKNSFYYDLFIDMCCTIINGVVFNVDEFPAHIGNLFSGSFEIGPALSMVKTNNTINIPTLIGLVY